MELAVCNFIASPDKGGKFVVLTRRTGDGDGIMAFSDFSRDFQHHDIVVRWERTARTTLAEAGLRVAGGGWWRYEDRDFLVLYGQSAAYGRFDPEWVRRRLRPGMLMRETRIDVR